MHNHIPGKLSHHKRATILRSERSKQWRCHKDSVLTGYRAKRKMVEGKKPGKNTLNGIPKWALEVV